MKSQYQRITQLYTKIAQIFKNHPDKQKNIKTIISPPRMDVIFSRPKRYNAFTIDMYLSVVQAIKKAETMNQIKFIVISGEGGNFSSGNDLTNFTNPLLLELAQFTDIIKTSGRILKHFTQAIVTSKKPLIAITEGKVIGVSFTELALFDKVFSVKTSSFCAPLVSSAQGPQLCASYTFPKIFGKSVAEELVTFGKAVDADFLAKYNFVQKCQTRKQADQKVSEYLNKIDELQWNSYINARRLYRQNQQPILLSVTQREITSLVERWLNPELLTHIAKHMQRMKKKAAKL